MKYLLQYGRKLACFLWLLLPFSLCGQTLPIIEFQRDTLEIKSGEKVASFRIEIAETPQQRARGLMYRTEMAPDQGMLFVFAKEQPIGMWMKNTPLSLDMLFADRQGTITKIHERAEPFSLRAIQSDSPVYAVLELPGGTAAKIGIRTNDRLLHRMFAAP